MAPGRDDDEVAGAEGSSGASIFSCICCTVGHFIIIAPTHVIADHRVLYATVTCLLADTVLVVLTDQLPPSSKVVALNGT